MKITPLANALGAEVDLPDLRLPLAPDARAQLIAAWQRHLVLRFRGHAPLTPDTFIQFSRLFGELERHDNYLPEVRHAQHPELLMIKSTRVRGERIVFGQQWHADLTYTLRPAKGALLYCLVLPPVGGDTLFANMQMAYDALSPAMRRIVDRLEAVHDLSHGTSHRGKTPEQLAAIRLRNPPVVQPMVSVHPDTGRKALFVSEWMCSRIVGMSEDESRGLLAYLFQHATRPEFTFRQSWQTGDMLIWDNRATIHMALTDYPPGEPRELMRTSLIGSSSGRPWAPPEAATVLPAKEPA